ncbi:MAG: DUF3450 domain-containing protein [Gammaproteobacteria bacterium]|jgi:hypothetical protein|nr:MAG: DUF3450 domain-containing protein [Gammaproteobacteria bacterium]
MRIDGTAAGRTVRTSVCCSVSRRVLCLLVAVLGAAALAEESTEVADVLEAQTDYQAEAIASQSRLDTLDDETLTLISQYNSELARYEDLRTYNENMRQLLASQAAEKARLDQELAEVEVVRRSIVPLMVEMVDVLEQFIELDQPMLKGERRARLDELKKNLTRSDVEIAERYRRVIEAYQIEADYGQTIEAYEGPLKLADRELTVDYLRVGRVSLYYLSLDRETGGIWDSESGDWVPLADSELDALDFAVRVARKQAPPNLVPLPLWTRETR